jgi:hypothetical protein
MKTKLLVLVAILFVTFGFEHLLLGQWVRTNFSLPASGSVTCFAASDSSIFCGTEGFGVFKSIDGMNWSDSAFPFPYSTITALATIGQNIFASSKFRSTDNGSTWHEMAGVCADLFGTNGNNIFGEGCGPLYRYTIGDTGWVLIHEDLNGDDTGFNCFTQFGSNIVASFPQYYVYPKTPPAHILYSSNNGITWIDVNGDITTTVGMTADNVSSLTSIGNNLFAGTDSGVFLSTNYGLWTKVNDGLPNMEYYDSLYNAFYTVNSFAVSGTTLFAAIGGNIFFTTNNGSSWVSATEDLPDSIFVNNVVVFDGNLYATNGGYATNGSSIWRRPLSDFGISAVAEAPLVRNALHSYPNPFSQSTQITFTSQAAGYADVSVVNILGAPVAHLFSGELDAGEHEYAWDASTLSPGSYWCIVRMGDSVERIALLVER